VIIDPLEMVRLKDGEKDNVLADGVRRIANVHRVPLLIVHHINKDGQKEGNGRIQSWMSKGFKRIQEQVDHIWAFEGTHDTDYRRLSRMMGRRSQDLNLALAGNKETLQFRRHSL
jgi:RecA-family ATPase